MFKEKNLPGRRQIAWTKVLGQEDSGLFMKADDWRVVDPTETVGEKFCKIVYELGELLRACSVLYILTLPVIEATEEC